MSKNQITLRDQFAMHAISAAVIKAKHNLMHDVGITVINWKEVAESAYEMADAMMKEREK